ncbi:MAG TPA: PAS domain-containing protein [Candidatus Limnocylindria bacterium]
MRQAPRRHRAPRTDAPLTPRQSQVLARVTHGLENKQIATELGVSEQAVKEHVSLLLHRFGVPNRAALAETGTTLTITGSAAVEPAWLQYLFSEAPVMISMLRGPDHVVEVANEAFRRACADREFFGRPIRDVFPEISSEMLAAYDHVYASGESMVRHEMPAKFLRDGVAQQGYGNFVFQPLRGKDGAVNGVMVFCIDVTEEVRARQDLAELAEEHLAVLDQIQSSVLVFNSDGRLVKINEAGVALVGSSLLGSMPAERRDRGQLRDANGLALALEDFPSVRALRGETVDLELTYPREDGTLRPLRGRATPLRRRDGSVRGAVLVLYPRP